MTADEAIGRRDEESLGSVRQRLTALPRERWILLGILGTVLVVHGWRVLQPIYIGGDLLYHWGLTHTILLGSFPPEGPYAGLPSYYPPGFHVILAMLASIPRVDVPSATALLGVVWMPVIPLGAYLLTRRLTGRGNVALVAAALTAFGGGVDLANDRLWVNSMFLIGQVAYPIYPRDLVFGILPFAVLAFVRATDGEGRWAAWALVAGGLLGLAGLIQIQLLLPIPIALAALAVARGLRDPGRWMTVIGALAATGLVAALVVGPWLVWLASMIGVNGGVSIDSSADLLPVRIGFWDYPIQFGLILPLAVVGAGVGLLFLRRADGPRPAGVPGRWAPRPSEGGLLLVTWWVVPSILAILYQPSWPLEDALRPQRLWMIASQPGLILAAMGLVALAEAIAAAPGSRIRHAMPVIVVVVLVATVPVAVATTRLLASTWTEPVYAHLRLVPDRVPDFAELLDVGPPRSTVLTYEDWSSLAWYETGVGTVAVVPPGYAKLAFDPKPFTGHGQDERRADLAEALRGDRDVLAATADRHGADRVVLARRGATTGLIGQPAALAGTAGAATGATHLVEGNGWDAVALDPGATLAIPVATAGPIDFEIRLVTPAPTHGSTPSRFTVRAGETVVDLTATPSPGDDFTVVKASVDMAPGGSFRLEAIDPITVQSVTGFVPDAGPPPGWAVATTTDDAVVWQRDR